MQNTPQAPKQYTPTEKAYLEKSKLERILFIIGALCFIISAVLALTYSGFTSTPQSERKVVLIPNEETLWCISIVCGLLGGALVNYRDFLAAIPAGLLASLAITDITLVYVSFRQTVYTAEILVPLAAGSFVGVWVYKFFYWIFYKNRDN